MISMFWLEADMQRVEKVHCKTLQIVYNNYMATFHDLLTLNNELKMAVEICQSRNKLNPRFIRKVCAEQTSKIY